MQMSYVTYYMEMHVLTSKLMWGGKNNKIANTANQLDYLETSIG